MVARKDHEGNFIPGIYNYCDRWCERCPLTHRCYVYYKESIQRSKFINEGRDPEDPETVVRMVEENLLEANELIEEIKIGTGIELGIVEEEPVINPAVYRQDVRQHHLHAKAHKFAMDCHRFLDKLCAHIHDEERKGAGTQELGALQESFEVLGWYHMQIAVKIDRALGGKLVKSKRPSSIDLKDANGSAKVAHIGMVKSVDALTRVFERNQSMHGDVMPLLNTVYELISDVDQEFPGHKKFKRPGFGD